MKTCPYCSADNQDIATTCFYCGRNLDTAPYGPPSKPQARIYDTQPGPYTNRTPGDPNRTYPAPNQPASTPYPSQMPDRVPAYRRRGQPNQPPASATPPVQPTYPASNPGQPYYPQPDPYGQPYNNGQQYGAQPPYYPQNPPQNPGYPPDPYNGYPNQPGPAQTQAYPGQAPYYPPNRAYPDPTYAANPYDQSNGSGEQSRLGGLNPLLAAMLGLVLLCLAGFGVWMFTSALFGGSGSGSPISAVFSAVQPTSTPEPTATPQPTFTLEPTLAPTSDPGLEKLLSPECSGSLDELKTLTGELTNNPAKPLDEAWRNAISKAADDMKNHCGSLETASPVPGLVSDAQSDLAKASEEFDTSKQLFKEGVDNLDPGKIMEAGSHVTKATDYLNKAMEALGKIGR